MISWKWLIPTLVIGYNVGFDVRGAMDRAVMDSYKEVVELAEPIINAIDRASKTGGAVVIHVRKTSEKKPVDPRTIV